MTKYDDLDWKELPQDVMEAAKKLGYDEKMWDKDKGERADWRTMFHRDGLFGWWFQSGQNILIDFLSSYQIVSLEPLSISGDCCYACADVLTYL